MQKSPAESPAIPQRPRDFNALGFFARVVLVYGAFLALRPVLSDGYSRAYEFCVMQIVQTSRADLKVSLVRLPEVKNGMDLGLVVQNPKTGMRGQMPINSRKLGYLPTSVLVALVVASSIPWRRRRKALLWGFILVTLFATLRIWFMRLFVLAAMKVTPEYVLSEGWQKIVVRTNELLNVPITTSYIVPVFIWILVTFRRSDLADAMKLDASPSTVTAAP